MKRTLKKLFKKDKLNVMLVFVFIIGLSVMLYPPISSYWNSKVQSRAVASYSNAVKSLTEEEKDTMLKKADTYNEKLKDVNRPFLNYAEAGDYNSILDISGTGIMGYVTIEKLGVELPIYHGTSEGVLQVAAGHLEGSSLPVGGEGTHSVLSAHRGLPSARLFTNLDKMEAGDTFTVTVLDRKLTYQVDQIKIVEPQEINDLTIEEGKDYCTLMTCTPYGINSHRLLVRGERISQEESGNFVTADGYLVNTSAVAIVVAIILLFWILLGLLMDTTKAGYIFAFQVLPTIIFFSALTSLLFYLGIIQKVVYAMAWVMTKLMNISGMESLSVAGNIFLGQTEAPLMIKEYLDDMSPSEIFLVMTGGMATKPTAAAAATMR